jgi:hypothetical protein
MSSPAFAFAASHWRSIREEFELVREAAYEAAETGCSGVLLNHRGKRKGIDPYSLFIGSDIRARAYASEELIEWWAEHPRLTFAQFERERWEHE